ncbi:putative tripeptidyl-peptidase II [Helianthus annuus]|nr:putative tripeptidyl-peptidase II [Helianthus annuus]
MFRKFSFVLLLTCTTLFSVFPTKATELKTYIVHLSSPEDHPRNIEEWYNSFLLKVASRSNTIPEMVYPYHQVITGFAAKMSADQAKVMESLSGVLSISPESVYQLHTTRSSYFLGLRRNSGLWKDSNYGKGTIIGVIDSGITPGHPSFKDDGVPPPPSTWKGKCEVAGCNNKLIGMRSFVKGQTPIDDAGHGTHTSSTAAGNWVDNASVFQLGNGTACGMAPLAHIAMYKTCDISGCFGSDILAGMDAAIIDGVNVLSISLGSFSMPFYKDILAIAAFTATQKGISVSCSAGNAGPYNATLSNEATWILTVGASTIDRRFRTTVRLGNNKLFHGESLYQPKNYSRKLRPLVYGEGCSKESLDRIDVKGKVVLCDVDGRTGNIAKGMEVKKAGGAAMIVANDIVTGESIAAQVHVILASYIGYKEGVEIKKYLNSTSSPTATILCRGTVVGLKSDPEMASFSSRGPNRASPGILKPDVTGPGVDILAAWNVKVDKLTQTNATFFVVRGTSMSCPHLAGIMALLKSAHPEWSPAAIKSAIMTTASQVNRNGSAIVDERDLPANVFAIGSGHVNPPKANEPGLVFDIQPDDYIPYLCGLGYTPNQIETIVKKKVSCSKTITEAELNYPSFVVSLKPGESKTYSRTVTNVGLAEAGYSVRDSSIPPGVSIEVGIRDRQDVMSFTAVQQKGTYEVKFTRDIKDTKKSPYGQGHMTWVSETGKYTVRTPFVFKFE